MDKRQNNKKSNKNKNKNKPQNNKSNNIANHNNDSSKIHNLQFEQPVQQKLSYAARDELRTQIALLLKTVYEEANNPKAEWDQYVRIQDMLQSIQVLEEPLKRKRVSSADATNRLANIDKFYEWAKENGIKYDGLEIAEFPGFELGLKATRDIKRDEMLFGIPKPLILSEEHTDFTFAQGFFKPSNLRLAFALMVEALKPNSFWKPYLDLLPESYNTVLYFSIKDMEMLKSSNALSAALKQCRLIARLYAVIYHWPSSQPPMGDIKEYFSYDLYRWAVSTVMTRENLIPRSEPKGEGDVSDTIAALIPFWDMANHRDGIITTFFNVETNSVESSAQADFKKDDQIFIYYGDRSNADLMIHNGFINTLNPKDSVSIKLGLSPTDQLYDKRAKLLELLGISNKSTELKVLPTPNYISAGLLAFVRVFNMNEEQLDHWIASDRAMDLLHIDCGLETELEMKTWQYLQTRLMLLLRVFPTTMEEDEKLLAAETKLSHIQHMIVQYRLLEKRILTTALEYAKERTKA